MKAYSTYKDSGLPWVGNIPAHWDVFRGKRLFIEMNRPVRDEDDVITAFRDGTVTLRSNRRTEGFTNSILEIGYQGIRKGDLVIHQMDGAAGAIGVSDSDGKSTPVYVVCTPRTDANTSYYAYLLRHMARSGYIYSLAKGIRERSTEFRWAEFSVQNYPAPPRKEQDAVVAYLDSKLADIDRYISEKERLIELLQEQTLAIIHHAVTSGVNPKAKKKPSNIEWLEQIPNHWEVIPLRYLGTKFGSGVTPKGGAQVYQEMGIPLIRSQNVHFDGLRLDDVAYISNEIHKSMSGSSLRAGDVLLNITGASIGRSCVVPNNLGEANVNQHVCIIRPKKNIRSQYLSYFFLNNATQSHIWVTSFGAAREGLNQTNLKALQICVPPLVEQDQILSIIEQRCVLINSAIETANKQIEQIQKYRIALIAEVVTGKIDVRS